MYTGISYNLERNENGAIRVRVTAHGTKTIADLRRTLELLMKGKTLDLSHPCLTSSLLHLVLTRDGINILHAVENETGTYIMYDRQYLNVKIFGTTQKIEQAEKRLLDSLVQLHKSKQLEIKLKGLGLPPNLMKEVIRWFGPDLGLLKLRVPSSEFSLNTRRHVLYVRGSMEDKQRVEEAIAEVVASIGSGAGMSFMNRETIVNSALVFYFLFSNQYLVDSESQWIGTVTTGTQHGPYKQATKKANHVVQFLMCW